MNTEKWANAIDKTREWSKNNPILRNILWYLFFPITFPIGRLGIWSIKWITFKMLDKAIKEKNENHIFQICKQHLINMALINEWKIKFSKKWFYHTMRRHERKLYDYSIKDKSKISFNFFRTMIDIYCKYNIVGGGFINKTGDTTITIE